MGRCELMDLFSSSELMVGVCDCGEAERCDLRMFGLQVLDVCVCSSSNIGFFEVRV